MVLTLIESVADDADFDSDGDIDGADFLTWQRGVGASSGASIDDGDANGDGAVNGEDLQIWTGQFGAPAMVMNTTVPEPAAGYLIICALLTLKFFM